MFQGSYIQQHFTCRACSESIQIYSNLTGKLASTEMWKSLVITNEVTEQRKKRNGSPQPNIQITHIHCNLVSLASKHSQESSECATVDIHLMSTFSLCFPSKKFSFATLGIYINMFIETAQILSTQSCYMIYVSNYVSLVTKFLSHCSQH